MDRITGKRENCLSRAAVCRLLAERAANGHERRELRAMARRWSQLADYYKLAEQISGHLQWQAQRL
jgi:hypothetical protein